MRKIMFIL
jgi:calcium-dependent protein kinase